MGCFYGLPCPRRNFFRKFFGLVDCVLVRLHGLNLISVEPIAALAIEQLPGDC
jgi:hypothetical protein